ncbi:MAG: 2Fe-2S iron-sulfur cluster-binding protein [Alphaproteobacteria bacterium]
MISILIQYTSFAILASAFAYLALLVFRSYTANAAATANAEIEQKILAARVGEIMDRRRIFTQKSELSWEGFRKFEVMEKNFEGGDICSFYLKPHDRRDLPPFEPGQYLTFQLDTGETKPLIRCYSLSDSPKSEYYRVSIKRCPAPRDKPEIPPGRSSNFFHDSINVDDILDVKAPSGKFFLDTNRQTPVVLIGGGVGITPVMSMLNQIVESGSKRETWFFYGVRNKDEAVMCDHLKAIGAAHDNIHVRICYSRPGEDDVEGEDYHHACRVGADLFKEVLSSNNYDFYFCGPPPMMNTLFEGLREWNVPEANIHYEAFGPATVKKKKEADSAAKPKDGDAKKAKSFNVIFDKSGKTIEWDPDAETLLDFGEANGIAMDSGCRAGNCGTCITAIKKGNVAYVSEPGDTPEDGSCLACICTPDGELVVDA